MLNRTVALAGVLAVALGVSRVASQAPAFAAGVVSEDGLLVPFARFDGAAWSAIWPEPGGREQAPAAPASLSVPAAWYPPDGAVPAAWHLWLLEDPRAAASPFEHRTARALAVVKAEVFDAHCLRQVGLRVDYRGPEARQAPANQFPRPKAGVALTLPSLRIDPPVALPPDSPLARVVFDRAAQAFHRAEEDHLEVLDPKERRRVPALAARRAARVTWTRVVRLGAAQAPERTYYLEGEIEYAPDTIVSGHVWVQISNGRETADAEAALTDQDRRMSTSRRALGVVRVGERRFWLFETSRWEHETYEIVEVSGHGQRPASLLEVAAGGC